MEYVYLLTNAHVPELVKFGFSSRDPRTRATELSAPTGVPGKWEVHHFWEVEDGYGVEQEVFRKLAAKRLDKQEFFRMRAAEAVNAISYIIGVVGTNPTHRAREEAERKQREAEAAKIQREAERRAKEVECVALKTRLETIDSEISAAERPYREADDKRTNRIYYGTSILVYLFFLFFVYGDYPTSKAMLMALFPAVVCFFIPIPQMIVFAIFSKSPYAQDLATVRKSVLAKHGYPSEQAFSHSKENLRDKELEAQRLAYEPPTPREYTKKKRVRRRY